MFSATTFVSSIGRIGQLRRYEKSDFSKMRAHEHNSGERSKPAVMAYRPNHPVDCATFQLERVPGNVGGGGGEF